MGRPGNSVLVQLYDKNYRNGVAKMNDFRIVVEDDTFISNDSCLINTIFFIEFQGKYFPDKQWTDFAPSVLGLWKTSLLQKIENHESNFSLYFIDGPYRLDVKKNNDGHFAIDCVCFRYVDNIQLTIRCNYVDFLRALHQAFESLKGILYKNDIDRDRFDGTYQQVIISMRELDEAIIRFSSK